MRRSRKVREHRDALLKEKVMNQDRRQRLLKKREVAIKRRRAKLLAARPIMTEHKGKDSPALKESPLHNFINYSQYTPQIDKKVSICHCIESMGLGGAQTMMMELVNGLNKYFGDYCKNFVVIVNKNKNFDAKFPKSYGITVDGVDRPNLKKYCKSNNIDIVIHHRISISKCLKDRLSPDMPYLLINHTFHKLDQIAAFDRCDYYISVCDYLHKRTKWPGFIHPSRRIVILNGVENDYLSDLKNERLEGGFKSGRCHRLVNSKFKLDSLRWMEKKLRKEVPNHFHYLIGNHSQAKTFCKRSRTCRYLGLITDRRRKMSIIKSLDMYFYETFQHEGASIAILEALACGVPVLCKSYGGNAELIKNEVNGYIMRDRSSFQQRMKDLSTNLDTLKRIKESTKRDFEERLHVKHTACKYMQLFESLVI